MAERSTNGMERSTGRTQDFCVVAHPQHGIARQGVAGPGEAEGGWFGEDDPPRILLDVHLKGAAVSGEGLPWFLPHSSWVWAMLNQGLEMGRHNVMAGSLAGPKLSHEMERSIRYLVRHMPSHQDFLAR